MKTITERAFFVDFLCRCYDKNDIKLGSSLVHYCDFFFFLIWDKGHLPYGYLELHVVFKSLKQLVGFLFTNHSWVTLFFLL